MRSLSKFILIVLILAGLVIVGGPFVTGIIAQKRFNEKIAVLNNELKNFNIQIESNYTKGLFNSTAKTDLILTNPNIRISLIHKIMHGPVFLDIKGWLNPASYIPKGYGLAKIDSKFADKVAEKIAKLYKDNSGYSIITVMDFDGKATSIIKNDPLVTALGKGQLNWQGLTGDVKVSKDTALIDSTIKMPLLEYTEDMNNIKQQLYVSNINLGYNYSKQNDSLKFNTSIDAVKIVGAAANEISFSNITLTNSQVTLNELVNLDFNFGFNKLDFDARTYGPLAFALQFKNLDASIYRTVTDKRNSVHSSFTPAQMLDLLHKKPIIDVNFTFNTTFGDIILTVHTEIGNPDLKEINKDAILQTLNITKHSQVSEKLLYMVLAKYGEDQLHAKEKEYFMQNKSSNIKNPYTMSEDQMQAIITAWIQNLLQQLAAQKLIVLQDGNVIVDMSFANNSLVINGAPKTPEEINNLKNLFEISVPNVPASTNNVPDAAKPSTPLPVTPSINTPKNSQQHVVPSK